MSTLFPLVADYVNMPGLLAVINDGLTGSGLLAQDSGGVVLLIAEASNPRSEETLPHHRYR